MDMVEQEENKTSRWVIKGHGYENHLTMNAFPKQKAKTSSVTVGNSTLLSEADKMLSLQFQN